MTFEKSGSPDPSPGARFGFDVEKYRPGVPVLRTWRGVLSEAVRQAYAEVPPVVWLMVRRLYVTGVCGTSKQLRAQLRFKVQRDVAEDLIALYFSENAEDLEKERNAYLEQLHRAGLEEELAMGANPALERYHRIAANIGVLLDSMVGDAIETGEQLTPKELTSLTNCLVKLQEGDPLVALRVSLNSKKPSLALAEGAEAFEGSKVDDALEQLRQILGSSGMNTESTDRLAQYEERSRPKKEREEDEDHE